MLNRFRGETVQTDGHVHAMHFLQRICRGTETNPVRQDMYPVCLTSTQRAIFIFHPSCGNRIVAGYLSASDLSPDLLTLHLYDEHPFFPQLQHSFQNEEHVVKCPCVMPLTIRRTHISRNSIVGPTARCFSINALTAVQLDRFPMPLGSQLLPHGHTSNEKFGTKRAQLHK